ncbi:receptor-type tyrosine-protein phosphatase zeta isoform X1 [Monodelphis domestica]|uniref:receptor-type tyrosine-protein phosphatase zeta isoform X1 n=1 Tax=Monodelphis domestica TaxID=13616 RepID=UPI0024E1B73C|nr:receptor-type tyrosine-protein phosphatase zeta isoform X1 [Monodelphis domestica]
MLPPKLFLACLQLFCVCRLDWAYGYYRQQRKLVEEIGWSYTGTLNQKNWGKKYPTCNGPKQSPINIDEDLTQVNVNLKKLNFQGWDKISLGDTFIHNTGKTVEINLTNDYRLSGGGIETMFKASKITFHWGRCNMSSDGSEHSLEGQKFPLEMQIYCFDPDQFESFEEAVKGKGKLRALSILFEVGGEENMDYKAIVEGVDGVSRFGKQAALNPFVLLNLLPNSTDKYYTYNGSLTTPPCTESVNWIVFKDTISISESQLAVFCEVLTMQQSGYVMLMDYLQNNFREQQYKFSRQVFSSYTGEEEIHETVCSSEPENIQADPENFTSLLVTWERPRVVYDTMIEKFAVFYQQLDGEDQTKHEFLTDGYQDLGAILNNLLPNTSYVLQIVAVCTNGLYGKYSDQLVIDMPSDDTELDLPEFIETGELFKEEDDEKDTEQETLVNPSTTRATSQIRKEPQVTTISNFKREQMKTKSSDAKTNQYLTEESEFLEEGRAHNVIFYSTYQPVTELSAQEKDISWISQNITDVVEAVSTSPNDGSKTTLHFSQISSGEDSDSSHIISGAESQETSTDSREEDSLLTSFQLESGGEDSSGSVPATSITPFVSENVSHGYIISSESTAAVIYDVLLPGYAKNTSKDSNTSDSEESLKSPPVDGKLWFHNMTGSTTDPDATSDNEKFSQTSSTDRVNKVAAATTGPSSMSPLVPQETSIADLEMPHYSTFAYFPTQVTPHSFSPTSGHLESTSAASDILSQTTQPGYNGEILLQPSYSSEVFPLVTPLLSDNQMLDTTLPAASGSDLTLHATPVFPSVGVSFESTLSSYGDVLLPYSSASFSSEVFHHLYTVSQIFPQVTPAVASDKVSPHAFLPVAEVDSLLQPSLAQYSDVMPHQTAQATSETFALANELGALNKTHALSQVEMSSRDLNVHVPSTVPELAYALSDRGSLQTFPVSYDATISMHDPVQQGSLFSTHSKVLMHKPSVIAQTESFQEPTKALSSDTDWSGTYSGSEFLLPDTDGLIALNISSPVSVDEFTYTTSVFSDVNKLLHKSDGEETVQQISSFNEMAYHSESTAMSELPTSTDNIIKPNVSLQETSVPVSSTNGVLPGSLALPTPKVWGPEISQVSENHVSVQPLHATSPAFGDTLLKPIFSAISEQAFSAAASSEMSPTQPLFFETSSSLSNEALLQTSFQSSGVGTLLKTVSAVPSDPILVETSTVDKNCSSILHPMASESASSKTLQHSTSVPIADVLSPTSSLPTASLQGLTISYANEEYVTAILLKSEISHQVEPSLYSNGDWFQSTSVGIISAFPPTVPPAVATPDFSGDSQPDAHRSQHIYSDEFPNYNTIRSLSDDISAHVTLVASDTHKYIDQIVLPLPNEHILVTAISPTLEDTKTLTGFVVPSQTTPGLTLSTRSNARSVVAAGGGSDDEDDSEEIDDYEDDGLSVKNCISCISYRESQEKIDDSDAQVNNFVDQSNLIPHLPLEKSEEEIKTTGSVSDSQLSSGMEKSQEQPTSINILLPKHSHATRVGNSIQTGNTLFPETSESKSLAIFTSDEESGSGQSALDSFNDNETSTDFSFPDLNDKDTEGTLQAGDSELTTGSPQSSAPSVANGHSVFNVSEAEASNSSHESRIGLAEGLESEKKTVIPLVIVSALTFICLVVLVGILIYWRKCFQTAHFYLEDSTSPRVISTPPTPIFPISDDVGAIPIKHFPKHVADLHASNGFTEEFETLKEFYQEVQSCTVDLGITSDSSNHPDNKNKNRYINIVAYDHSRVKLAQLAEKDGRLTDYINANYVDGYNRPKAYIAAQGPLKSTAEDFWRMIWEHNVEVIVMITNLVEKGRRKCDQYWPVDGSEEYGNFLVTQKSVRVLAYYTVRNFTLRNTKIKKGSQKGRPSGRVVTQYHYTQWPDMGVPEYTLPVLTFVRKASHAKRHAVGPVAVHCSAGVGRTGTYIVLDSMLQQIQHEGTVNIFGFLKHIRSQRNYLVQTEEQYVFIHDALVEAILSKETEVLDSHMHAYVNSLLIPGPAGKTRLEKQFKLLSQSNIQQCDYSTALKQCNREKNRTSSIIPVERSRVGISSLTGEGTDYINASYIMGYYQSNEFIITQHPLLHTIKDFWRMIWDHNAQLIVMLPESQNMAEDEFVYWPNKDEPINCESFKVTMIAEEYKCLSNEEKLIIQDFILEATQDDYVLEVRHFQCPRWPNPDSSISKTFELISIIKEEASNRDGPMIVHDEHGGVTAGTFCALTTLMHQLEKENSVDVYHVAKMINLMRPGVFTDIEQYQFLYKAILSLVNTRQEENPSTSLDSNGTALPDGNVAESLESLV